MKKHPLPRAFLKIKWGNLGVKLWRNSWIHKQYAIKATLLLFCFLCCYSGLKELFYLVSPCVYSVSVCTWLCSCVYTCVWVHACEFQWSTSRTDLRSSHPGHQSLCRKLLGIRQGLFSVWGINTSPFCTLVQWRHYSYRLKLDPLKRYLRPNPLHACLCDNLIRLTSLLI